MLLTPEFIKLFENRIVRGITEDTCWGWSGGKDKHNYGYVAYKRKIIKAHRISAQLYIGNVDGMDVLHTCDNPICCNPLHLRLGTHADNMKDMSLKGRACKEIPSIRGELHHSVKLTNESVLEIYKSNLSQQRLADKYRVSIHTIKRIQQGVSWKSVTGA